MQQKELDMVDEEFAKLLMAKCEYHLSQSNYHLIQGRKYKAALEAFNQEVAVVKDLPVEHRLNGSHHEGNGQVDVFGNIVVPKKTFQDVVIDILSDGKPKTTRMLHEEYGKRGQKPVTPKDFSSKLSIRAGANDAHIKNTKLAQYPPEARHWWGLTSWFDGDSLKEEFLIKISRLMGY
jgi:hypothetical protein